MNVIVMIDNLDLEQGGGVGSFVYDLCCELIERKVDLTLVSIVKNGNEQDSLKVELQNKGIKIYCAGANNRKDALLRFPRYVGRIRRIIEKVSGGKATICNLHLKLAVLYGAIATRGLSNIKCVETYHSQYSNYWLQYKLLSHRISLYIGCSKSAKEEFLRRFRPNPQKVISVPNGIRIASLRQMATQGKSRERHELQIVSVGRFTDQKNFQVTAAAFSKLSGDVCYRIIGQGEKESEIRKACIGSDVVEFSGTLKRNDVLAEVKQADIVVMPSLWEGLSIFMLETMALGIPMMLSDIPSFRDVFGEPKLNDDETWRCCSWGFLVQTNNIKAYQESIEYYRTNEILKEQMMKVISKYSEEYDMRNCADKYIEAFHRVQLG